MEALESLLGVVEAAVWEKMKPNVSQRDWAVINRRSREAPMGGWRSSWEKYSEAAEMRRTAEERNEEKEMKKQEAKERERERERKIILDKMRDVISEGVTTGVKAGLGWIEWNPETLSDVVSSGVEMGLIAAGLDKTRRC